MKKILIFASLLILSHCAFAQAAALTINNHNSQCKVFVYVYAVDANLGDGGACNIQTKTIIVGPSTSVTYASPSSVPLFYEATPFSGSALATELASVSASWAWTDAGFQYQCTDCGTGGSLSEVFPAMCTSPNCMSGGGLTWGPLTCSPPVISATWTSPGNCVMNDVTIDFY